jgi:GxxExxY protein
MGTSRRASRSTLESSQQRCALICIVMAPMTSDEYRINQLTWRIIKCAMKVHTALGPGLLESAYQACLVYELRAAGLQADVEVKVPLTYGSLTLECGYRLDILVEGLIVVEVKCVDAILPVHEAQLITYIKLAKKPYGLMFNFNVPHLKAGIVRKANTYGRRSKVC